MKLTASDKRNLRAIGHCTEDFPQIEEAADCTEYTLCDGEGRSAIRRITRRQAEARLGREAWVSGLSRSAFHTTAMRQTKDGQNYILFDSSALFR